MYARRMKLPSRQTAAITSMRQLFQVRLERQRQFKTKEHITLAFANAEVRDTFIEKFAPLHDDVKVQPVDETYRVHSDQTLDEALDEADAVFDNEG